MFRSKCTATSNMIRCCTGQAWAVQQAALHGRLSCAVTAAPRPLPPWLQRGILSMARGDDPSSGGSSFSILLGPAPHLDMTYTIFGEVVEGWETLSRLEELPTRREGIFVMPLERIDILSSHMCGAALPGSAACPPRSQCLSSTPVCGAAGRSYLVDAAGGSGPTMCTEELGALQRRFDAQSAQLERIRKERLP